MKFAIAGRAVLTAALCVAPIAAHASLITEPILGFAGAVTVQPNGADAKAQPGRAIAANSVVYDNTASAPNFGFASTDLTAHFGDRLLTTGTGLLSSQIFTLYNSSSSTGPVLTATVGIDLYDGVTSLLIGSYSTNINFGAGLNPGFFSLVTVTNIDPLNITVGVTNVIVLQHLVGLTGTATSIGIASLNPPTVGSSPTSMYIQASTVNSGIAGFYTVGPPANPGYQLTLGTPTVGVEAKTWSTVKDLYR